MFAGMATHFPSMDPGSFDPDKQQRIKERKERLAKLAEFDRAETKRLWMRRLSYVGVALVSAVLTIGFLYAAVKAVRAAWGG